MLTRPFQLIRFLPDVYGTPQLIDYCRERQLDFNQEAPADTAIARWSTALAVVPPATQERVQFELAMVNEMAGRRATALLMEAAGVEIPPPDTIPGGRPLALWYLVHHPDVFRDAFFCHEIEGVEAWRTARAPAGLKLSNLDTAASALRDTLGEFFRVSEGIGRFCAVEAHQLGGAVRFVARVADRMQFFETFTDAGTPSRQRLRPARGVHFAYYPDMGTVLLHSHLRSRERITELLSRFGHAALGSDVTADDAAFRLDVLKSPFRPLPDRDDMEGIRLKALHLRYPSRESRRTLKLETRGNDAPTAIDDLLRTHVDPSQLARLEVCHAELQVRLRVDGRHRPIVVRLWPDRCNVPQTPLGDRLRVCLRRWGLTHNG